MTRSTFDSSILCFVTVKGSTHKLGAAEMRTADLILPAQAALLLGREGTFAKTKTFKVLLSKTSGHPGTPSSCPSPCQGVRQGVEGTGVARSSREGLSTDNF